MMQSIDNNNTNIYMIICQHQTSIWGVGSR